MKPELRETVKRATFEILDALDKEGMMLDEFCEALVCINTTMVAHVFRGDSAGRSPQTFLDKVLIPILRNHTGILKGD